MLEKNGIDLSSLDCPVPDCKGKLTYTRSKTNTDKSVRVWKRKCDTCGLEVDDSAIYQREFTFDGKFFKFGGVQTKV